MDADERWIVLLGEAERVDDSLVGGKALRLADLARRGFAVPKGFCVTVRSYERFVNESKLVNVIDRELGRKPFSEMRWEEIWDAALRIRSAFLSAPLPGPIGEAVRRSVRELGETRPLAVRSSAPGEDSAQRSFAGLHESLLDVVGADGVLDALRVVWASLWSDAALLYRNELALDPRRSRMGVVIQEMIIEDCSGVAFGRDPRSPDLDREIIEAVAGRCSDLVDGLVDPDRWILSRSSGEVVEWRRGERRGETGEAAPILELPDLAALHGSLRRVEDLFGWPPDLEWTGRGARLTLVQARPVTTAQSAKEDSREWYLGLRPAPRKLEELGRRVVEELIPELERIGERLASESLEGNDDRALASVLEERLELVNRWRATYWDELIPFAHGVRRLATYYNDHVRPHDPYEFVGLLRGMDMLASRRNRALDELASHVASHPALVRALSEARERARSGAGADWRDALAHSEEDAVRAFWRRLQEFEAHYMDIAYGGERLAEREDLLLSVLMERVAVSSHTQPDGDRRKSAAELEETLFAAVGEPRRKEAEQVLEMGRLSWKLRDDDNLLLGRLESQLLKAVHMAGERLRGAGRLPRGREPVENDAAALAEALRDPSGGVVRLTPHKTKERLVEEDPGRGVPRQLIGQPAAPGMASGRVRRIRTAADLGRFRAGEVLVCDAIQPSMTHLVPLSVAVVERRGGMLIHGAIIARELGIPCVNGVPRAVESLRDGELVTVDGYLGIVTVGPPEFDLERAE